MFLVVPWPIPPYAAVEQKGDVWRLPVLRGGHRDDFALVDACAWPKVGYYRWRTNRQGYAVRTATTGQTVFLHWEVMGLALRDPACVDHINGDPLDNRRRNLRLVTRAENAQNRRADARGRSRHRGVSWVAHAQKWQARVCLAGERHHLGLFASEDHAAEACRAFRAEHMPFSPEARGDGLW